MRHISQLCNWFCVKNVDKGLQSVYMYTARAGYTWSSLSLLGQLYSCNWSSSLVVLGLYQQLLKMKSKGPVALISDRGNLPCCHDQQSRTCLLEHFLWLPPHCWLNNDLIHSTLRGRERYRCIFMWIVTEISVPMQCAWSNVELFHFSSSYS